MSTISFGSGTGLVQLAELLKRLYASWEIEQLVNLTYPVLGQCAAKGTAKLGGDGFRFAVRTEANEGHAYISETQALPPGRGTTVLQATAQPKIHVGRVELSGLSMAISSGDAMAFARAFDENVQQNIEAMTAYKEGAFFRDGSGQLATFVTNPDGVLTTFTMSDVGFLREGMVVDVVDTDLTTHHNDGVKIIAVDWPNKTITTDVAVSVNAEAGDFIYLDGSQVAGVAATSKEPTGLEAALLATGTYLGISRTTNANWRANAITVSAFLDEDFLLRGRTRITQESGVPLTSMAGRFALVCHPQQVDVLFKLAIPRIRFTGDDDFDLGYSANVSFGGIKALTSYLAPVDKAYLGDWQYCQSLYTPNGELHIDTEYNGSALKWVPTQDVGLVFMKEYHEFIVRKPIVFVRYTSLSTPTR